MFDSNFDYNAFAGLENEMGVQLLLCNPTDNVPDPNTNVDFRLGVKAKQQVQYEAIELQGYAYYPQTSTIQGFSQIPINQGDQSGIANYLARINATNGEFSPEQITKDSYLGINGRFYQLELVDPIYDRGQVAYYEYKLIETDLTKASLSIISTRYLTRNYNGIC